MSAVPPPPDAYDQGVPWHFGDPLREQRWLAEGTAAVDMRNHGILTIEGPDRLSWLHSLTTQHLLELQPGVATTALILSPQGHVEHELHLIDDGSITWIITQPGDIDSLREYLEKMKFMLRVDVVDRSKEYSVIGLPVSTSHGWTPAQEFQDRGYVVSEVVVPHDEADETLARYEHPAGSWAREAMRVAALMPRTGLDTDHRTIPNEMGWLNNAVHLDKGCYRGQETVAKVNNLGQPPRRFALLHLDGSSDELPRHGDAVTVDGKAVGWIGTAAQHYELGPIATAMLKRSVAVDADLRVQTASGEMRGSE